MRIGLELAGVLSLFASVIGAIEVNFDDDTSIKEAASTVAFGLMKYYTGNNTGDVPGNLPDPYFWWEAGAMFGTLIDYWYYTGDSTYNEVTMQAIQHQVGGDEDFMPENQTSTLGNDDQGFWTMTAMSAVENNFENPPEDQPQWLALVQAVFNEWADRWNEETLCGGGLRWQIFPFNNGYNYKNSISNGCMFNIASRLARYTGNDTYADWAGKVWDWMELHDFIDPEFNIYDGAGIANNCDEHDSTQWTYNAGIFLQGAAMMYNHTGGDDKWRARTEGLARRTAEHFFEGGVVAERACEPSRRCNIDQQTFKGYLMRWMASASVTAPFMFDTLMPLIRSSAQAAAQQCSGDTGPPAFRGVPGTACGFSWLEGPRFDGLVGVGEQMSALSALQYSLIKKGDERVPVTADTGGTSVGNVNAGTSMEGKMPYFEPVTTRDRVAAGFLTSAVALGVVGGSVFLMKEG
ncbi:hypothetical protein DL766_005233 [Monosporascus sp. MC13-8B]|uniref:Mannan endo-1,6-alpha-mannosidase n=1 Tax=Monosporascus cannonballus TaxID=155416 RepID=A0ABY0GQH3_9PEZI|nr:hypothetical protein DL762_010355 [Monosporascus cannonballus]RYO89579.1 hypothetical protein DL763_005607 [Monosporascus cannonballus]RYP29742.1 hypothetical protein DL766_005233 [Monosporascus sp. MC13-8B]